MSGGHANQRGSRRDEACDAGSSASIDLRELFACSPHATFIIDSQGRVVLCNRAACELTRYSSSELQSLTLSDLGTLVTADQVKTSGRQQLVTRKDGERVVVDVRAATLAGGMREIVMRDLSDNPLEYKELSDAVVAFHNLVQVCSTAVISVNSDGAVISWNPAAEALFGYKAGEALGMPVGRLVPERLRHEHALGLASDLEKPPAAPYGRTLQTEALAQDGREVPVELTIAVSSDGERRSVTALIRDLSEYRNVVDQLNDAIQRLRFHVKRMPLAYIVWDQNFHVVEWNPAAERIFGYSAKEAIGRHAYELIVPEEVVPAVDTVWDGLIRGKSASHSINPNQRKDGTLITCEWFNTALHDANGEICGAVSMTQDITERTVLEARIRDAQRIESLGVLASGVAHDFNSSLMVILGNTSLLGSMKDLPEEAKDRLAMIDEAGAKAAKLIQHMLTYARTGKHNPQPTNLNTVAQGSLAFVRSTIGTSRELALELAPDLPPIVADVAQVEQVILNLCVNAHQAMPGNGTVTVATRAKKLDPRQIKRSVLYDVEPGHYAELVVSDEGSGIPDDQVSRIFDPFYSTKHDGHGLGLAAVLGILRQHDGTVLVKSRPNRGTSMHVYFPLQDGKMTGE